MKFKLLFSLLVLFLLFPRAVFAQTSYALPYPSFMPGSAFYKPHLILEALSKYLYFGNLGQFKYNLKESDKYLVEAKTLFEYGQFLYASNSLKKSDQFFNGAISSLSSAKREGKDISSQRELFKSAALKHIDVLNRIENSLPETIAWRPEKVKASTINIKKDIEEAIFVRKKIL